MDHYEPSLPTNQVRSLPPREPAPAFENRFRGLASPTPAPYAPVTTPIPPAPAVQELTNFPTLPPLRERGKFYRKEEDLAFRLQDVLAQQQQIKQQQPPLQQQQQQQPPVIEQLPPRRPPQQQLHPQPVKKEARFRFPDDNPFVNQPPVAQEPVFETFERPPPEQQPDELYDDEEQREQQQLLLLQQQHRQQQQQKQQLEHQQQQQQQQQQRLEQQQQQQQQQRLEQQQQQQQQEQFLQDQFSQPVVSQPTESSISDNQGPLLVTPVAKQLNENRRKQPRVIESNKARNPLEK